ncbi:MAG: hypothetical protein NTU97_00045 [Candidatus Magasanikbacteria bacterium]|nr:hypothetical protein [Candidatus Magasanikbacteria bacterium]
MQPIVSFLVPTVDFDKNAIFTVDSILKCNFNFDFEIICCSKKEINYNGVIWESEPEENRGSVLPINLAYKRASGKYVSLLNDDFTIDNSFVNILNFLDSESFPNKIKISALYPISRLEFNDMKYIIDQVPNGKTLPCQLACFPVALKSDVFNYLGRNLLDSRFSHHFSDMYLTYYIYKKFGETIPLCRNAII